MDVYGIAVLVILYISAGIFKVTESATTPILKWPLLPNTCKYEVLLSNIYEVHPLCRSLWFAAGYPITTDTDNDKSVAIPAGFFFDVDVPDVTINDNIDYGISVYVYPRTSGPVFDYLSNDGSFQLAAWIENGMFKAFRRITTSPETYLVNDQLSKQVLLNTWQKVGVSVDTSGKKLKTIVADNLALDSDNPSNADKTGISFDADRPLVTPGKLRLGGMFNDSVPRTFSGMVTCIGLVLHKDLDVLTDCVSKTRWKFNATFGNEATQYAATFKGMRLGSKPTASPIHQSVTKSPIMCSVTCLRDFQTCRSFTYEKQSNTCLLYPEIYTLTTDFNHMDGYTYYQLESYV